MAVYNLLESTMSKRTTTTTTTRQEYEYETDTVSSSDVSFYYRSQMAPRSYSIPRRPAVLTSRSMSLGSSSGSLAVVAVDPATCKLRNRTALEVIEGSEREKRELAQLNDKFANYMERVRFLEIHNKKLELELAALEGRDKCQESSKVREMYEIEMYEAARLIGETAKDKEKAEARIGEVEDEAQRFRRRYQELLGLAGEDAAKIEDMSGQLARNEAEVAMLKRRCVDVQDEARRYKTELQRLLLDIQRLAGELEAETLQQGELWNEKCDLEEELDYLRQTQANELQDLCTDLGSATLTGSGSGSGDAMAAAAGGADPAAEHFQSELGNAINEVRNEYEMIINSQRQEMKHWYSLRAQELDTRQRLDQADAEHAAKKTRELRETVAGQKRQVAEMKARNAELEARVQQLEEAFRSEQDEGLNKRRLKQQEIDATRSRQAQLMRDYEVLARAKTTLQDEIRTYRRLLEGDSHVNGLKQVVEDITPPSHKASKAPGVVLPITRRDISPGREPASGNSSNSNPGSNTQLLCISEYSMASETYEEQVATARSTVRSY